MAIEKLKPSVLKNVCDPNLFDFDTTKKVSFSEHIIDQKRAEDAIMFGLNINAEGFNLYISGSPGTGRTTSVLKAVEDIAKRRTVPDDMCYIYNFKMPDEPKVLMLPAGKGMQYKKDMELLSRELVLEIQKSFESKEYEEMERNVLTDIEQKKNKISVELEDFAKSKGFVLKQTAAGIAILPVSGDKVVKDSDLQKMSNEQKVFIAQMQKVLQEKLNDAIRQIKEFDREAKDKLKDLDEEVALYAVGHIVDEVKGLYEEFEDIQKYLDDVQNDIIENIEVFKKEKKQSEFSFGGDVDNQKQSVLKRYEVNLLVDNSETKGAPVIIEHNPSYYNLIGKIEYVANLGMMLTDFTMIKPGAIHKANGGYLIIQALDILKDQFAWDALKKVLQHKQVKTEDINDRFRLISTYGLKPGPIPVDIKVIMVGPPDIFELLYYYDETFRKIFKVKAEFESHMDRNPDKIQQYVYFIASKVRKNNLLDFHKSAVARIVDYGSRLTEHREKLTTKFSKIETLLREANYWAVDSKSKVVTAEHVEKAIRKKIYRLNMTEERINELIEDGTILIDVKSEIVGQINGISVMTMGEYSFGKPTKITVKTFLGKGDLINIEREVKLSGNIHSKGVYILHGYLGSQYAQDKPLALSASICFEQLYSEIDGDSASSAELYCLLSSIADVGIKQGIAVTGSVNQNGFIQPIGGVNEKIEGFFDVCKIKGLDGKQGVIIPVQNVKNLMLKDEVIKAVEDGKFNIYTVEHIEEGMEILTGMKMGEKTKSGHYQKGTLNFIIDEKLRKFANWHFSSAGKSKDKNAGGKKKTNQKSGGNKKGKN